MLPTMPSLKKKGSARKGSIRYTTKPPSGLPEFEMLAPSGKSNGFVIQIAEGRPSLSESVRPLTAQRPATHTEPRQRPQPPPLAIPPKAHITEEQRPGTPPSPPNIPNVQERAPSPTDIPLPHSSAPTPTIGEGGVAASPKPETPVMRSMFPRYDPSRPLDRQSYYPHLNSVPGLASAMATAGSSRTRNSNNPYRQQMARRSLDLAKPGSDSQRPGIVEVKESPLRTVETAEQQTTFSKPEDLVEVWNIANGQAASEEAADTYSLELSWQAFFLPLSNIS